MIIFTSICANYLHKARTLAKSVKENIKDATFIVCLLEREIFNQYEYPYFDEIILAKDIWEGNFDRFIFKHNIVEASTSVKGHFFKYLQNRFINENQFVYLDPDIYVYDDFIELKKILDSKPIVLCPHLLQPGNIDMELSSTAHGVYNLGFLAVNNTIEARSFIEWWSSRLYLFCYDDIQRGIFTDQKWVSLAPCFFDVEILKHNGYDFAPWSLLNSKITKKDERYFVNNDPLRFIHFSGYGEVAETCIKKWLPAEETAFKDLYKDYAIIHDSNDYDKISSSAWSYNMYFSGEAILKKIRIAYRSNYDVMFAQENPFDYSNRYFARLTSKTKSSTIELYILKVINIIKHEGLKSLIKKVIIKIRK